ncbi:2Fe-2S iron-sulfur cluster-binding protein [Corallincola platygyrae]|uniref:2Fe-2S iron-sulfur cluster-binding protein n=1 Tax=Corallincola platygyrae TaxID=1193278 RepID=A0ABW4XJM4_9GAMM
MISAKNASKSSTLTIEKGSQLQDYRNDFDDMLPEFGCCKGMCGLCLIEITAGHEHLGEVTKVEEMTLTSMDRDLKSYRLACQLSVQGNFEFKPIF